MNLKKLSLVLSLIPCVAFATTANYYSNKDLNLAGHHGFFEKIHGAQSDPSVMPAVLVPYEKDQELYSGHYILNEPLYANEILILADGPLFGTVWRSGTEIRAELNTLAALTAESDIKKKLEDYQIIRFKVYPQSASDDKSGIYVYQVPGLILNHADCDRLMGIVQSSGYQGRAFSCTAGTFKFIPVYSHQA